MSKRVLDVGQCDPDHFSIRRALLAQFAVEVDRAHLPDDTFAKLRAQPYDLVLINRKLDNDYSDGLEILKQIKADPELQAIPVMLITNYPEHQQEAVACGGVPGFGKKELGGPILRDRVAPYLGG